VRAGQHERLDALGVLGDGNEVRVVGGEEEAGAAGQARSGGVTRGRGLLVGVVHGLDPARRKAGGQQTVDG
jgi:hypothetical protein